MHRLKGEDSVLQEKGEEEEGEAKEGKKGRAGRSGGGGGHALGMGGVWCGKERYADEC
jgi:hypothetical protein